MLEALCEKFDESTNPNRVNAAQEYRKLLYYHADVWSFDNGNNVSRTPKITHSRLDKECFESVITGKCADMLNDINEKSHKIFRCYKYFKQKLSSATEEQINIISRKLLDTNSHILVVINLGPDENEQAIFDTINSAGVKLNAADIIKNALYQKIDNRRAGAEEHYKENWWETFEKSDEIVAIWEKKRGSGVNQKSYIDMFFHCYAIMTGFFKYSEHKLSGLSNCYKEHVRNMDAQETKAFIKDICNNAKKYKEIFIDYDPMKGYKYENHRERLLHILSVAKVNIFDAFILYAVNHYSKQDCNMLFKQLETYVMRNYVLGNRDVVQSYNKDLVNMLSGKFDFCEELNNQKISKEKIQNKLRQIDNTTAKLILFWTELYIRATTPTSDQNETGLVYNYQLEHVMPQSWKENWSVDACPVCCEGTIVEDTENAGEIREKAIYDIGNMTLLTAKLNGQISNASFADKLNGREIGGKFEPGIRQNSSLRITVEDIVTEPEWNEAKISARTKKLTELFEKIWPIPQVN